MMKRSLLLLLLLVGCGVVSAQPNGDIKRIVSILDSLNNKDEYKKSEALARQALQAVSPRNFSDLSTLNYYIGYAYRLSLSDTAIYYLEQALYYGKKAGNPTKIFDPLNALCELYCNNPGYEAKRNQSAAQLRTILDTAQAPRLLSALYSTLSSYYSTIGDHETQIMYDIKSLDAILQFCKNGKMSANDSANVMIGYLKIGENYLEIQQYEKATEYIEQSRAFVPAFQPSLLTYYYRDIAITHINKNQLVVAHKYADSLVQLIRLPNAAANEVWENANAINITFAEHFLQTNNADSTFPYLKQILSIADSVGINPYIFNAANATYGKALILKKDFSSALHYFKKVEASTSINQEDHVLVLQSLARCYAGLKDWQNAYNYYDRYASLRDTLYRQSAKQSLANAEARFQNKEKQEQINAQKAMLSYARKQRIGLIAGLVLLGLTVLLLGIIYRNKKRNADLLAAKNKALDEANATKAKLFSIIGHDLRSPINQVYQFLKLQQRNPTYISETEKEELSDKIQTATGSLLETMEDLLLWSKTQLSAFHISPKKVAVRPVIMQCLDLLQLNTNAKLLTIENDIPDTAFLHTDPYFLQIILRNLLQNAVKASPHGGKISIDFLPGNNGISIINQGNTFSQQNYETSITDDTTSLSGLGLKLVDELSRKVGATVHFEAVPPNDTKVTIVFP